MVGKYSRDPGLRIMRRRGGHFPPKARFSLDGSKGCCFLVVLQVWWLGLTKITRFVVSWMYWQNDFICGENPIKCVFRLGGQFGGELWL